MDYPTKEHYTAEDLIAITALLRDPVNGCPWDKVQTHESIRKNFLEETCEVLEAIDTQDADLLCEELGDVLMQIALHSCMEAEQGHFTFSDVCTAVCKKLIFRHPHIFSTAKIENTETASLNAWETLKNKEKGRQSIADELSSVPITLPALMKAQKTQKRAARYEKIQTDPEAARAALACATAQFHIACSTQSGEAGSSAQELQSIAGDVIFALANQMRLAGVDAEEALALATRRFVEGALN